MTSVVLPAKAIQLLREAMICYQALYSRLRSAPWPQRGRLFDVCDRCFWRVVRRARLVDKLVNGS